MITLESVFEQAVQNHNAHSATGSLVDDQRFAALALAGEAGELANFVKKEWRDGFDHSVSRKAEIADCFAYTLLNAHLAGMTLDQLLELVATKQLAFVAKMEARGADWTSRKGESSAECEHDWHYSGTDRVWVAQRRGRLQMPQMWQVRVPTVKIVAVLESMWDWRQMTSGAGYKEAPRSFRINPDNYSGKRLYRIVGRDADLHVTNACRELCGSANHHGTPDPVWLRQNLALLAPFDVLLVCGKVAQETYALTGYEFERTISIPHPAARMWTTPMIDAAAEQVSRLAGLTQKESSGG